MTRRRRFERWLGVLVVAGFVVRVVFVFANPPDLGGDSPFYRLTAHELAAGHGYTQPFSGLVGLPVPTAQHPPLFSVYLAAWTKVGVNGLRGYQMACCLLGAATVLLVGLLGRRVGGPPVGLIAGGVAAVYPWLFMSDRSVNSESLYLPLIALVLLLAYRCFERGTTARAAALGAAIGVAALVRSDAVFLVVLLAVPVAWRMRPRSRALVACLAAAALVLAPWLIRNWHAFHSFPVLSTNSGNTLAKTNCDATYYEPAALGFKAESCGSHSGCQSRDELETSRCQTRVARSYARRHLSRLPVVALARIERTWEIYRPTTSLNYGALVWGRPRGMAIAGLAVYAMLVPAALAGAFMLRRRNVPVLPLLAMFVQVCLVAAIGFGESRFRAAAEPALVVLAAVALDAWWRALFAKA